MDTILCRDHVEWGEEQQRMAKAQVEENSSQPIPDDVKSEPMQSEVSIQGCKLNTLTLCMW